MVAVSNLSSHSFLLRKEETPEANGLVLHPEVTVAVGGMLYTGAGNYFSSFYLKLSHWFIYFKCRPRNLLLIEKHLGTLLL